MDIPWIIDLDDHKASGIRKKVGVNGFFLFTDATEPIEQYVSGKDRHRATRSIAQRNNIRAHHAFGTDTIYIRLCPKSMVGSHSISIPGSVEIVVVGRANLFVLEDIAISKHVWLIPVSRTLEVVWGEGDGTTYQVRIEHHEAM